MSVQQSNGPTEGCRSSTSLAEPACLSAHAGHHAVLQLTTLPIVSQHISFAAHAQHSTMSVMLLHSTLYSDVSAQPNCRYVSLHPSLCSGLTQHSGVAVMTLHSTLALMS